MKVNSTYWFTLVALLLFPFQSTHASYFQKYCSNAEQTTTYTMGQDESDITLTRRVIEEDGSEVDSSIVLNWQLIDAVETYYLELDRKTTNDCQAPGDVGIHSWELTSVVQSVLSRTDGEIFDMDIIGATHEGTVESFMVCEEKGHTVIICQ